MGKNYKLGEEWYIFLNGFLDNNRNELITQWFRSKNRARIQTITVNRKFSLKHLKEYFPDMLDSNMAELLEEGKKAMGRFNADSNFLCEKNYNEALKFLIRNRNTSSNIKDSIKIEQTILKLIKNNTHPKTIVTDLNGTVGLKGFTDSNKQSFNQLQKNNIIIPATQISFLKSKKDFFSASDLNLPNLLILEGGNVLGIKENFDIKKQDILKKNYAVDYVDGYALYRLGFSVEDMVQKVKRISKQINENIKIEKLSGCYCLIDTVFDYSKHAVSWLEEVFALEQIEFHYTDKGLTLGSSLCSKGNALNLLLDSNLISEESIFIGIGNDKNDPSFLNKVDISIIVGSTFVPDKELALKSLKIDDYHCWNRLEKLLDKNADNSIFNELTFFEDFHKKLKFSKIKKQSK